MASRKRRASTSSVESINGSQVHWRQETSVVRTVASNEASEFWPTFELRNAIVLNKDGQTIENALHVGLRGPYIVRGHLIIDDATQKTHLITRVRSSTPLEIRQCTAYSIGQQDNRNPVIWISGRGGWYEINPSPAYRAVYRKMCEATTFYFDLVDIYNSMSLPKKPKKSKQSALTLELDAVFHKYAARVGDGVTLSEARARSSEHAGFFISQFAQKELDWEATGFHRWLTTEHPDLANLMKTPLKLSPPPSIELLSPKPRNGPSASFSKSASVEQSHVLNSEPMRRLRGSSSLASPASQAIGHGASKTHTAVESLGQGTAKAGRSKTRQATLASSNGTPHVSRAPAQEASVPQAQAQAQAQEDVPRAPAQETRQDGLAAGEAVFQGDPALGSVVEALESIFDVLQHSKKGLNTTGVVSKLYYDYSFPNYRTSEKASYRVPVEEILRYNAAQLLQVLDKSRYEKHEIWSQLKMWAAEGAFEPKAYKKTDFPVILCRRKSMPRGPRKDAPQPAAGDAHGTESAPTPRGKTVKHPGRKPGKSSLRPASATKKRPRSEFEEASDNEAEAADQSHYFDDESPDAGGGEADARAPHTPGADGQDSSSSSGEQAVKLVIHAEKLPSPTPKGTDGVWACDQDGCDYVVRGADEADVHAQIEAHFHDHEQQLERVSLAMSESRGHLPINHLLDKIKRMGGDRRSRSQEPDAALPQRIKRRLIV